VAGPLPFSHRRERPAPTPRINLHCGRVEAGHPHRRRRGAGDDGALAEPPPSAPSVRIGRTEARQRRRWRWWQRCAVCGAVAGHRRRCARRDGPRLGGGRRRGAGDALKGGLCRPACHGPHHAGEGHHPVGVGVRSESGGRSLRRVVHPCGPSRAPPFPTRPARAPLRGGMGGSVGGRGGVDVLPRWPRARQKRRARRATPWQKSASFLAGNHRIREGMTTPTAGGA